VLDKPIETLLDSFQLESITKEEEVDEAYKQLFSFGTLKDRQKLTLVYNTIKKKIRTKPQNKNVFLVKIKQNCKICENIKLKNGLKLSSGLVPYPCNRCKGLKPKVDTCRKCNSTGQIQIRCPSCHGKKYVVLKRRVQREK